MIKFEDGKIVTDLCDISFIEHILRTWGGYEESEVEAISTSMGSPELTDEWLKSEGIDLVKNAFCVEGKFVCLVKVGNKEWVIEDAEPFEMEQFVKELK